DLNAGPWLKLEYHCQKLSVDSTKELYIIAGGIFHSANTLNDKGKVFIPDSCFKIVVVMDKDKGLKDISAKTTVIAVIMPNIRGISKEKWIQYITTVDRIEGTTGYDFLDKIPDKIENILEAKKYQPPPEPDKKSKNLIIDY
ncbi:MAG: endonuclease mitochondrial, partial [Bacteroidota bacterium]|nr:endonuclease mitochondrial [Bacteroidota bacterium]